jgi:hypothetical protein
MNRSAAAGFVAALSLLMVCATYREATRPGSLFLRERPPGSWIRDGDPLALKASDSPAIRAYRTRFEVSRVPPSAHLTLRTTGQTAVLLDGQPIAELPTAVDWNEARTVELAAHLTTGEHLLEIQITNTGASVLAASLDPFHVETGPGWLAKGRDGVWRNAVLAGAPTPPLLATQMRVFERPAWNWLAGAAAFSLLLGALVWKQHAALKCSPSQLRRLLLATWAFVAVNNFSKLPTQMGMDFAGHIAYVQFIFERRALPLATDGWQMFQSPLYYLLCAGMASLFHAWNGLVIRMFRLISIASALGQIEIAYRIARRILPEREDLQKVAILVSGLLPMGFCVSQGIGNEPLHGALGALTLLLTVRLVQREGPASLRDSIVLGAVWGLALLAKVTAVLLAAPLSYALLIRIRRHPSAWRREVAGACLAGLSGAAVAGWYYARNWLALGTPFAGGWLPRGDPWWQEPGYRTVEQLTRFGTALVRPFNSAIHGFWDSYYSTLWADGNMGSMIAFDAIPPWNYAPMLASVWLALLPSALIALGLFSAMVSRRERGFELVQIGVIAFATQMAAALLLFVRVPIYSQGKATYTLALTPVFGLLAAYGFDRLGRNEVARVGAIAGLGGWAALVLCSYFVV